MLRGLASEATGDFLAKMLPSESFWSPLSAWTVEVFADASTLLLDLIDCLISWAGPLILVDFGAAAAEALFFRLCCSNLLSMKLKVSDSSSLLSSSSLSSSSMSCDVALLAMISGSSDLSMLISSKVLLKSTGLIFFWLPSSVPFASFLALARLG